MTQVSDVVSGPLVFKCIICKIHSSLKSYPAHTALYGLITTNARQNVISVKQIKSNKPSKISRIITYIRIMAIEQPLNQIWILKNSKELLENSKSYGFIKSDNIKPYDFSTLYTTIPLKK
jgi:hypothetical protein